MLEQLMTFGSAKLEYLTQPNVRNNLPRMNPYLAVIPDKLNSVSRVDRSGTKRTFFDPHLESQIVSQKRGPEK